MALGKPGQQLQMFMTPREIHAGVDAYGDYGTKSPSDPTILSTYKRHDMVKLQNNTGKRIANMDRSGMAANISTEGVKHPVNLVHGVTGDTTLTNGHHRLLAQEEADPDRYVPVLHDKSINDISRGEWSGQWEDPKGDAPASWRNRGH